MMITPQMRQTARMLNDHYSETDPTGKWFRAPNGYRRIGEGVSRVAILERSTDLVYKIGDAGCNKSEAVQSRRILRHIAKQTMPFELRIPRTGVVTFASRRYKGEKESVVIQEYAKNTRTTFCDSLWMGTPCRCPRSFGMCFAAMHNMLIDITGLSDIHGENVLMDKQGALWLIDMAD